MERVWLVSSASLLIDRFKMMEDGTTGGQSEFYVVGIGASAGGLEALEALFHAMPTDSGMAFVVIQHLSPDFKSHMEELLTRQTTIPIIRVENGLEIVPNAIYLIPSKMEMVISEGRLLLTERSIDRSFSHPIDLFFRSLASDKGRFAIGVILSGTGTDGARGVREIHNAGGLVISQSEASAKFDGMPLSAQATGIVDAVLQPSAIAEALIRYSRDGIARDKLADEDLALSSMAGIDQIFHLLNRQHRIDFSQYKASTVGRRIQRRINFLRLSSHKEYISRLANDPAEVNKLYKDLLIGVTKFFRDPEAFEALASQAISRLFLNEKSEPSIRIWVSACASGEEAYSIAMLVDEERRRSGKDVDVKVFATDAHPGSLQTAAKGFFTSSSISELSDERRERYFRPTRDGYQVTRDLREYIVFAPHNVISDAPFTQMDLVACRNMLIYLQPAAQKKVLSLLHFSLKASGTLFLGPSESTGDLSDEFQVIDKRWRIYTKRRDVRLALSTRIPAGRRSELLPYTTQSLVQTRSLPSTGNLLEVYDVLLQKKMATSILVSTDGNVLHVFGGAEKYLTLKGGRPTNHLPDSIHDDLRLPISVALHQALNKQESVRYSAVPVRMPSGIENVNVTVEPIGDISSGSGNLLVSLDLLDQSPSTDQQSSELNSTEKGRVETLELDLRHSHENLQEMVEEMETSNEELQAANEELVAANEELQSTNEELHSVNEELYTVNAEHQRRVEELAEANDDMENLLATTRVGVIFLDDELYIRRFTPEIARLLHLNQDDMGRPIERFAHHLNHAGLLEDLQRVLTQQQEIEIKVRNDTGIPLLLRMVPYRSGNRVDGVVLTLIDITSLRIAEMELERFKFMTESAVDCIFLTRRDCRFVYVNPAMSHRLGYTREDLLSKSISEIDRRFDVKHVEGLYEELRHGSVKPIQSEWQCSDGSLLPIEATVSTVEIDGDHFICGSVRDISQRLATEREMRLQHLAIESATNGIIITDPRLEDNPITYANPGFLNLTGYSKEEVVGKNCRFLQGEKTNRQVIRDIREDLRAGRPTRASVLNYRKDRTSFWNDLQITPVFDERGTLTNYVGVQHDITDQVQTRQALERANRSAIRANEAKSEFLATMSHELRTPLTAILGFADILKSELDQPSYLEKIDTIKRNGQYLLALLNDILDLSKIEAGKLEIDREVIDIQSVTHDVEVLMQVRATEAGIPLRFEYLTELPIEVTADEVRVRQVLVNLISNAVKFTDEGEVVVSISLICDASEKYLAICVRDTGIGITQEQQTKLFTPFNQATQQTTRRFGGTGLGLSISKRLAEGMGGSILVESEVGVGSRFTLILPVTELQAQKLTHVQPSKVHPRNEKQQEGGDNVSLPSISANILLADDRRDVWRIGKYFLERCGAHVTVVEDGRQAVDEVIRSVSVGPQYDLILMDMQMPVMTGREAVSEIRKLGLTLPIIALTADAMEGERQSCIQMGCNEYFPKPIDGPKLVNLISSLLS